MAEKLEEMKEEEQVLRKANETEIETRERKTEDRRAQSTAPAPSDLSSLPLCLLSR